MKMLDTPTAMPAVTDVYTNIHGMEQLKTEKNTDHALRKVAEQFESMFVNMMLKNMRQANAVFEKDSMFNSSETKFYRDMYDQQLSLSLSHGKGLGIADSMYRQMSQKYGSGDGDKSLMKNNTDAAYGLSRTQDFRAPDNDAQIERYMRGLRESSQVHTIDSSSHGTVKPLDNTYLVTSNVSETKSKFANSPEEFVAMLLPFAKQAGEKLGVDEKVILAQSALETGWGAKVLASSDGQSSNNLFNIKKGNDWKGDSLNTQTIEVYGGQEHTELAHFRKYQSIENSFDDYVDFIGNSHRYQKALNDGSAPNLVQSNEAKKHSAEHYIQKIHNAGYATDPKYANKVMSVYDTVVKLVDQLPNARSVHHLTQEALNTLQSNLGDVFRSNPQTLNANDVNSNPFSSGLK